jgi:DNA-binding NarL/FixJ family response regulator
MTSEQELESCAAMAQESKWEPDASTIRLLTNEHQRECIEMLANGRSINQIASRLHTHRAKIDHRLLHARRALHCETNQQLVEMFVHAGLARREE